MANRKQIFISFFILIVGFLFFVNNLNDALAQSEFPKACVDNGGVNCSILNPDGSVVCNDGTIDDVFIIYSVSECQETINTIIDQQSDFMLTKGCFPPSELKCINTESYTTLYTKLSNLRLVNSELGKKELASCQKQIAEYTVKNNNYKLCLDANNNSSFVPASDYFVKPLLKTIFCPLFYENASYEHGLCSCNNGYFTEGDKCVEADLICKTKYGSNYYAENGNCLSKTNTTTPAPTTRPVTTLYPSMSATPKPTFLYTPEIYIQTPTPFEQRDPIPTIKPLSNPFILIFNYIVGSLKNILNLF